MRSSDDLIRDLCVVRALRDRLRAERAALFCERAEPTTVDENFETHPTQAEACWKAARKWKDDGYHRRFYLDPPPSQWCESCRKRQEVSDAYREAVRHHGGALRGLLRRGKTLVSVRAADAVAGTSDVL